MKLAYLTALFGVMFLVAFAPAAALAGGISVGSSASGSDQMTHTAPARLTSTTADRAGRTDVSNTTTTRSDSSPQAPDPASVTGSRDLPYTGLNLIPETIAGILLVAVGVAMRARRA